MAHLTGKGSMTKVDLVIIKAFPQQGNMTGMNVSIAVRGDLATKAQIKKDPSIIQTAPMLVYDEYNKVDKDTGAITKEKSNLTNYSKEQYEKMLANSTIGKDGHAVFTADVFVGTPTKHKDGSVGSATKLIVSTKDGSFGPKPTKPFDHEKHKANITLARELKAEARAKDKAAGIDTPEVENDGVEQEAPCIGE